MPLYCPKCGAANEEFVEYCASCGENMATARDVKDGDKGIPEQAAAPEKSAQLLRSRDNKMLTGLAAGMAKYWGMDVDLVRLLWVIFFLASGGGVAIVYFIMALVIPLEPEKTTT